MALPKADGMIDDIDNSKPDVGKLDSAIAGLDEKFDKDDVTLYLSMCSEQWPDLPELATAFTQRG